MEFIPYKKNSSYFDGGSNNLENMSGHVLD
jgi:hypothetical protein